MAVDLRILHQTVHRADENTDYPQLKADIQALGLEATPANFNLLRNHIWREYNKRARIHSPGDMITPTDSGLRPEDYSGGPAPSPDLIGINGVDDIIGIDDNFDIILI